MLIFMIKACIEQSIKRVTIRGLLRNCSITFGRAIKSYDHLCAGTTRSMTYGLSFLILFYLFRDHNVHTMLMWDSAAIAVENDFFCLMQFPIMIEHKKFSGIPAEPVGILIRRNFHKRFIYKYIDRVYAIYVCVLFQVCRNFFPDFRLDKVKYSTAKNNVIVFGCTKISDVGFKKVYIGGSSRVMVGKKYPQPQCLC